MIQVRSDLLIVACCGLLALVGCSRAPATAATAEADETLPAAGKVTRASDHLQAISPVYTIDRIYKSMTGPWSNRELRLLEVDKPELLWITGCQVEMVGADGATHMPEQFMCHTNLDFDPDWHNDLFRSETPLDGRLFTLSQGELQIQFPPGFGIPVLSNEILDLSTQALNLNVRDRTFDVRHKVDVNFVRDSAAARPMKPLYERALMGMVSLEDEGRIPDQLLDEAAGDKTEHHAPGRGHAQHQTHEHEAGPGHASHDGHVSYGPCVSCCVPGQTAIEGYEFNDTLGQRFSTHWIIKPGREENHTRVTTMMALPFDTTLHFLAVHMHPFAESLELRDVTADKSIFKSRIRNLEGAIGLAEVEYFSSAEGVPVYKDHEYELVSVYNNTTGQDQDSMAVMYAYFLDQNYRGPDPELEHLRQENTSIEEEDGAPLPERSPAAGENGPVCNAQGQ
ncbi:MAG TPA: hypothetical protein VHD36_23070 [Pirellulales bacterium]|nr:hypothetical protein [Pirellulales bacterium]